MTLERARGLWTPFLVLKAVVDKRSFLEKGLAVGKLVHVGFRVDSGEILVWR
jgi:hypothetical protein